jgi:hypothetical protein
MLLTPTNRSNTAKVIQKNLTIEPLNRRYLVVQGANTSNGSVRESRSVPKQPQTLQR